MDLILHMQDDVMGAMIGALLHNTHYITAFMSLPKCLTSPQHIAIIDLENSTLHCILQSQLYALQAFKKYVQPTNLFKSRPGTVGGLVTLIMCGARPG